MLFQNINTVLNQIPLSRFVITINEQVPILRVDLIKYIQSNSKYGSNERYFVGQDVVYESWTFKPLREIEKMETFMECLKTRSKE